MDNSNKVDCPYGADDCPKVNELKAELKEVNWKLNAIIMTIIFLHGAELAVLIS